METLTQRYFLDMLNKDGVSMRKQIFVTIDGAEHEVGEKWRRGYVNSPSGRAAVQNEVPEPYQTAIMAVWGESPTIADPFEDVPLE